MKNKQNMAAGHLFNSRLTSIISITLVLFLIGATTLMVLLTNELSVYIRENLTLSVVLKDDIKPADIQKLQKNSIFSHARHIQMLLYGSKILQSQERNTL